MTKTFKVFHGDCLDVLKELEDNSVDSVCSDPPYGLSKEPDITEVLTKWLAGEEYDHGHGGFMGKEWDSFVPHPDIWREVYRVLKPGGHALVFAGTRTQDLMTISLRLAGFEVRDVIEWLYFSGFPKSHNVGKAFDRREEPGLARKWDGWGTALKPAHEPIIVVRKPLHDGKRKLTVADCVEKYGTGAINIDASRIGVNGARTNAKSGDYDSIYQKYGAVETVVRDQGRFPANCLTLDGDAFYSKYFNVSSVANVSPQEVSKKAPKRDRNSDWQGEEITLEPKEARYFDGGTFEDGGFNDGRKVANNHPTVKPTDLMAWLVRLVTPPQGTVLDPFAGSGSTLVAAKREGFGFIGIEREAEYIEICEARTGEAAQSGEGKAIE